jgi:hypothetical protein
VSAISFFVKEFIAVIVHCFRLSSVDSFDTHNFGPHYIGWGFMVDTRSEFFPRVCFAVVNC